jgi:hypothetical protein
MMMKTAFCATLASAMTMAPSVVAFSPAAQPAPVSAASYSTGIDMDYASLYTTKEQVTQDWIAAAYAELPELWSGIPASELETMEAAPVEVKREEENVMFYYTPPSEQEANVMSSAMMMDMFYSTGKKVKAVQFESDGLMMVEKH